MSNVNKTSKRYFDQDIVDSADALSQMRKSKQYKALEKASAGNEHMLFDIAFQNILGNGEVFNPYELRSNIDAEQLQYQRMVNGEWIADDTQVPVGQMLTKMLTEDILFAHNRTDKNGKLVDSIAKGERVYLGQRNKAISKKRDNIQGKATHSDLSIEHDLKRANANKEATEKVKNFHLYLETLYFEMTGEIYETPYQKANDTRVVASPESTAMQEAEAEFRTDEDGDADIWHDCAQTGD